VVQARDQFASYEEATMGRKKPGKPEAKPTARGRARDVGSVTPLGVEVDTAIYRAVETCRVAKKWSKRTVVEEALKAYLEREGFWEAEN
jgi:hypothetical protein